MLNEREELGAWLRLLQTPGIGPETARKLLAAFGPPMAVWAQTPAAWASVVGHRIAHSMASEPEGFAALHESTWVWLHGGLDERAIVALGDKDYPAALLQTADPPCLLYATGRIGQLRHLQATHALAIVGSRNPSPQGAQNARDFARHLAASGLTIVSGLALGIDGGRTRARWMAQHPASSPRWPWSAPDWTGSTPRGTSRWLAASHSRG